jgi:hypothetical protein
LAYAKGASSPMEFSSRAGAVGNMSKVNMHPPQLLTNSANQLIAEISKPNHLPELNLLGIIKTNNNSN